MIDTTRFTKSIVKLIRLTNESEIVWTRVVQRSIPFIFEQYETRYLDHKLVFEHDRFRASIGFGGGVEAFGNSLSVYGENPTPEFSYPSLSALSGLHAAIRQQVETKTETFLAAIEAA